MKFKVIAELFSGFEQVSALYFPDTKTSDEDQIGKVFQLSKAVP